MDISSLLLMIFCFTLVIVQAGLVVRDKLYGAAAHGGRGLGRWLGWMDPAPIELSAGQVRFLNVLRVASCIGLVFIWGAFVYVLIHLGASFLAQPSLHDRTSAVIWSLLYTALVLSLMRRSSVSVMSGNASWRPSSRLASQAFYMLMLFGAAYFGISALIEHI